MPRDEQRLIRELEKQNDALLKQIERLEKHLSGVITHPWQYAYFLRVIDEGKRLVEIDLDGKAQYRIVSVLQKSLATGTDIELGKLQGGQIVWLSPNAETVVHTDPVSAFERYGEVASFEGMHGNEVIARLHSGDTPIILRPSSGLSVSTLKPGDKIMVCSRIAWHKVELKESALSSYEPVKDFSLVGGLDEEIERIRKKLIYPFADLDRAREFKLKVARGGFIKCSLLYGPPGCGKTLIAEAIATEILRLCRQVYGSNFKVGFFFVAGPEFLTKWVGDTEGKLRDLFLRETEPYDLSIIFWDEFGALFPPRGMYSNAQWTVTQVAQFNSLIGGFRKLKKGMLLIAADNRPDIIDPAVLRAGRFNYKQLIPRPNRDGGKAIFRIHCNPETMILHPSLLADASQSEIEAFDSLFDQILDIIFDETTPENNVMEIEYSGGHRILGFKDLLFSGSIIEAVGECAQEEAFVRWRDAGFSEEARGVLLDDFLAAYREQAKELEHLPKAEGALKDWLKTEGIDDDDVTYTFLREGKPRKLGFEGSREST